MDLPILVFFNNFAMNMGVSIFIDFRLRFHYWFFFFLSFLLNLIFLIFFFVVMFIFRNFLFDSDISFLININISFCNFSFAIIFIYLHFMTMKSWASFNFLNINLYNFSMGIHDPVFISVLFSIYFHFSASISHLCYLNFMPIDNPIIHKLSVNNIGFYFDQISILILNFFCAHNVDFSVLIFCNGSMLNMSVALCINLNLGLNRGSFFY